ncbi:MAG: methyltransferase domain-containing protein [Gammaproteobacteria bacterium]|jgi:arsenite methyltransferase|nr:methyltransferase domain-containing protein [Gammaproteobacteria bacterium]
MSKHQQSLEDVQRYYGEVLGSSADLQTSACCIGSTPPAYIAAALKQVHEEVQARFYGCGSPIPMALEGARILDLGCGTGRDCYVLAQLAGSEGSVIGVDMTEAQLAVARAHREYHAKRFGFANVEFRQGYIEDLSTSRIADDSVDVVVSNCVLNLSPDKNNVLREIFRVLKPGGELYFADVFADRRVPADLAADPVLRGECLGGALYWEDFRRLMAQTGCRDVRISERRRVDINNPDIERRTQPIEFYSVTVRAFKIDLEDRCEDYGQAVIYHGTIPEAPHAFELDDHHRFETHKTVPVCGNTADMIRHSRYRPHFRIIGDKSVHYGLFACAPAIGQTDDQTPAPSKCC